MSQARAASPDFRAAVEDLLADGDKVITRWSMHSTPPGSAQPVTSSRITIFRIADGKVVETWAEGQAPAAAPTPTDANEAVAQQFVDSFAKMWPTGDWSPLDALLAPDVIYRDPTTPLQGIAAYKTLLSMYHAAFADFTLTSDDSIAERDQVVVRWVARAAHRGEFLGVPPTGKGVTNPVLSLYRLQGGKIVEVCDRFDLLAMLQQVGVNPVPAAS